MTGHPHLRPVPTGEHAANVVPVASLRIERAKSSRRIKAAELLASRRDVLVKRLLETLPRAKREQLLGAGYHDIGNMTEISFGEYLGRIETIVGGGSE